jgi:hypothetical protein
MNKALDSIPNTTKKKKKKKEEEDKTPICSICAINRRKDKSEKEVTGSREWKWRMDMIK